MKTWQTVLITAIWSSAVALSAPAPAPAKPKPIVTIQDVKPEPIFDLLSYPARVSSTVNATILSESDGVVMKVEKPLGTPVKRGDALLRVQHTDPVYQYAPVVVRSPVNGVMGSLDVTLGARVAKGQKLATVTDPERLRLVIEVVAADLSLVSKGLKGEFKRPGNEEPIAATVTGVSPFVDPGAGTATAELVVEGKQALALLPGLVGRVFFKVREHHGVQLTEEAIVHRGKETFVRMVDEKGIARLKPITLGPMRQGAVEVTEGLATGDKIIVRASQYVPDGSAVTIDEGKAGRP